MKERLGFVSNSSSSSFVCDVCGAVESGGEAGLYDFKMGQCVNGHSFHERCGGLSFNTEDETVVAAARESIKERCEKWEKDLPVDEEAWEDAIEEEISEMRYEMPAEVCPFCRLEKVTSWDALAYLQKKHEVTNEGLAKILLEEFGTFDRFREFLKDDGDEG